MKEETYSTNEKLDTHTQLLKWILGGVGTAVIGLAVWIGSFINNAMSHRDEGEKYLRNEVLEVQKSIAKSIETQTKVLVEIRDDQKKFPAVASN